jgi:hypothetical protein
LKIAVTEGGRSGRSVLVRPRLAFSSIPSYNAFTNQVPATWIVGEVGIRRLTSHSDGPFGGRRFVFTLCAKRAPRANAIRAVSTARGGDRGGGPAPVEQWCHPVT